MNPRIVTTPIAPLVVPETPVAPRRVEPDVIAAALPGPGRDRLAAGPVLLVTTGQQPGLFTGPLYTVYKALSAIALARRLERDRRVPVVPLFWVAGDDHDFAEANHTWFLNADGEPTEIVLRTRAPEAPLVPLAREPCGPEVGAALAQLRAGTPPSEFQAAVLAWLERSYRPDATLADAFAGALDALLGPRGLVVLRVYDPSAKRAAAPWVLKGLDVTLPDGYTPVFVEASQGRDRLQRDGEGEHPTIVLLDVASQGGEGLEGLRGQRVAHEPGCELTGLAIEGRQVELVAFHQLLHASFDQHAGPARYGCLRRDAERDVERAGLGQILEFRRPGGVGERGQEGGLDRRSQEDVGREPRRLLAGDALEVRATEPFARAPRAEPLAVAL